MKQLTNSPVSILLGLLLSSGMVNANDEEKTELAERPPAGLVRVTAIQADGHTIDWRIDNAADVLNEVAANLDALERLIHQAGERNCDLVVLPEDTPGLLAWLGPHHDLAKEVLPQAVAEMLDRLGRAAAEHNMYLLVCSDHIESDGGLYNTAFLLGRDGKEIGRYHKTCPAWHEAGARQRGSEFPVFNTKDLGDVGMLICYDLVIPETARALALKGADMILFPTMGGAAVGDGDIGVQALRVRAAENFIWIVVAQRGSGAMIISPQGSIVAEAKGVDGMAIADIDPRGSRRSGDALNMQEDMRARLFRERNPAAFKILTDPHPPVLDKVPIKITAAQAADISSRVLSVGQAEFNLADQLVRDGRIDEAIATFTDLKQRYADSWIDRASGERLQALSKAAH